MLTLGLSGRIWLAVEPIDTRKSFDTLAAVVTTALGRDSLSGDLFVFVNKRRNRLKILAWHGDGFVLYLKRLEKGTFAIPDATTRDITLSPTQLALLLGGIDLAHTRPRKRYTRPASPNKSP